MKMKTERLSLRSNLMTDNEREEFAYDIADHMLKSVSQAGIRAMAIDRICFRKETTNS